MSFFIDSNLVDQAINLASPTINQLLGSELVGGRKNIFVVVIEPSGKQFPYKFGPDQVKDFQHPYHIIAGAKAEMCHRTGKPSGHVLHRTPWLFEKGDCRYAGGVVEDGLAVGVSGLQSHFDEMVAWMIFNAIAGLCMDAIAKINSDPKAEAFLH